MQNKRLVCCGSGGTHRPASSLAAGLAQNAIVVDLNGPVAQHKGQNSLAWMVGEPSLGVPHGWQPKNDQLDLRAAL